MTHRAHWISLTHRRFLIKNKKRSSRVQQRTKSMGRFQMQNMRSMKQNIKLVSVRVVFVKVKR